MCPLETVEMETILLIAELALNIVNLCLVCARLYINAMSEESKED